MSYLVLARKYRPQVFEDVVGQEHVTRTLANAISSGRIAHAYLFCGPRGIGKTTVARILAKALNCEKGPTATPCNACQNCLEITGGRSMDVLEIDGASNRGINEVRELRENTRYAPASGRYKVYIIDEVHMLTHEAFNALLKTLEEPPSHVVFVLATTEPFKVPGTILSRCQRFDFARIPARRIAQHLETLMAKEGIEATPEALSLVARRADGGVRDALSLMDQVIAAVDGPVDRPAVEQLLGLVGADFYYALTDLLAEEDAGGALKLLDEIYARGTDLRELAAGLTAHLRDLLLLKLHEDLAAVVDAPESELPRLKAQADRFDKDVLLELVDRAAETAVALRRSDHPRLAMELALAEMARAAGAVPLSDLAERLLRLERRLGSASGPEPEGAGAEPARAPGKSKTPPAQGDAEAAPGPASTEEMEAPGGEAASLWAACLDTLRGRSMLLWSAVKDAAAVGFAGDGALQLRPAAGSGLLSHMLQEAENQEIFAEILGSLGAAATRVVLEGAEDMEEATTRTGGTKKEARATGDKKARRDAAGKETPGAGNEPTGTAAADKADKAPTKAKGKKTGPGGEGKKRASRGGKAAASEEGMGQLFRDEPMLQKALDMFDGEVLP